MKNEANLFCETKKKVDKTVTGELGSLAEKIELFTGDFQLIFFFSMSSKKCF